MPKLSAARPFTEEYIAALPMGWFQGDCRENGHIRQSLDSAANTLCPKVVKLVIAASIIPMK
jgi:hypothetical protein